ncbi:50S ribosomal protein L22, partial [Brevundimonas sp. Root1423]|uniref:large ribosomal subunit protein uL22 n=1 Tax=Brevundimonas sp. Root1423 TaxID=1736462 RepID=UPI0026F439FE
KLRKDISARTDGEVHLNIVEVRKPETDAQLIAENNHNLDIDNLVVAEAFVGKNLVMKRFASRARGRSSRILKPFAEITIVVREAGEAA